jgi:hypothetical protein
MNRKLVLTILWIAFFVVNIVLVFYYCDGVTLVSEDFLPHITPFVKFYTPYLSGILAFWYFKPFASAGSPRLESIRFQIALFLTLFLNVTMLVIMHRFLFSPSTSSIILDDIQSGVNTGALLSFLVAPVNAYYFGMKGQEG